MANNPKAIRSNLEFLQTYVWRRLGMRKHLVGRDTVNQAVLECAARWPTAMLSAEDGETPPKDWEIQLRDSVVAAIANSSEGKERYGFVVMSMILAAVVGQIVSTLLRWWLEHRYNRVIMDEFRILKEAS